MCFSRNHLHPVGYGEHRGLGKPSGLCPAQDRHRGRPPLRARSGPSLPNLAPGIMSSGSVLSSSSSSSASACHDGQLSAEGVPIKVALLSPGLAFFFSITGRRGLVFHFSCLCFGWSNWLTWRVRLLDPCTCLQGGSDGWQLGASAACGLTAKVVVAHPWQLPLPPHHQRVVWALCTFWFPGIPMSDPVQGVWGPKAQIVSDCQVPIQFFRGEF